MSFPSRLLLIIVLSELTLIGAIAGEANGLVQGFHQYVPDGKKVAGCGSLPGKIEGLPAGYDERGENFYHRIDSLKPRQMDNLNNQGLRGENFSLENPEETYRILVLGDSYTYGSGIRANESHPAALERELKRRGLDVQVINAGWPGAGMKDYYLFLKRDGVEMHPDLVVVAFYRYDDNSWGKSYANTQQVLEKHGINRSEMFEPENREAMKDFTRAQVKDLYREPVPQTELQTYANGIVRLSRKNGFKHLFYPIIEFPEHRTLLKGALSEKYETVIDYWREECGMNVLSTPEGISLNSTYTLPGDKHYNPRGNRFLAGHLAGHLVRNREKFDLNYLS